MSWPWESKAAVEGRFYAQHLTAYTVTRSDSGHGFNVTSFGENKAVMQVKPAHLGNGNLRSLLLQDPNSQVPWLAVEESRFGNADQLPWEAFRGGDMKAADRLFVAVDKTQFFQWGNTVHVFLNDDGSGNPSSGERVPDFVVHGSYYFGTMTVSRGGDDGGGFVAQIRNESWLGASLAGRNKYTVMIKPDVDQTLLLALTVIIDQMHTPRPDIPCCNCPIRS